MASGTDGRVSSAVMMMLEYDLDLKQDKCFEVVQAAFQAIAAAAANVEAPRMGIVSYAAARTCGDASRIHFHELFADMDAWRSHLTVNEAEAIVEMYEEKMIGLSAGVAMGLPSAEDVIAVIKFGVGAQVVEVPPEYGGLMYLNGLRNKWFKRHPKLIPKQDDTIMLEFRIQPCEGQREAAMKSATVLSGAGADNMNTVSGFLVDRAWWKTGKDSLFVTETGFSWNLIVTHARGLKALFTRTKLRSLMKDVAHIELIMTLPKWDSAGEEVEDLLEHLADSGIQLAERREIVAGFLVHPVYTLDWQGTPLADLDAATAAPAAPTNPPSAVTAPPTPIPQPPPPPPTQSEGDQDDANPFTVRHHVVSGAPLALVVKAGHQGDIGAVKTSTEIRVPLLHLLRKIASMSRVDTEIPIDLVYAQLGRLRGLMLDAAALNQANDSEIEKSEALAEKFRRLLDTLGSLGFAMPASGRLPVHFEGVELIVKLLEKEYASMIQQGSSARDNHDIPVPYMALQELYQIGDIVTSSSIGDVGGTLVAFRVTDAYYDPLRSLFGGRKWSFKLVLESVVALAGNFVSVQFPHIFEEWPNTKDQALLPFQRLSSLSKDYATTVQDLSARSAVLSSLSSSSFSYQHYRAGCFFPHLRQSSLGGASSGDRKAAAGRLIIDSVRGCDLGHSPASSADEVGMAIANAVKGLRAVNRALRDTESPSQRSDKLVSAGLVVWSQLPESLKLICWPTVVGFSLSVKQWGHVLVDGLSPVAASELAWSQLVLPDRTKEMLLAMTASTQGRDTAAGRYRYRDVVDSKGGGVLFLLYGPPGTGKTLSVEALASHFGRPLYSLSFAELGSTVAELEERLQDVLSLAAQWGALVLLDEGDALVERRQRGQLLLNSMTGVLLRLLETFDGALFITSNRASSFDPAALSRVTLAVRYEPLDCNGRRAIWRNTLTRVLDDEHGDGGARIERTPQEVLALVEQRFDLKKLASFEGSGRSVGAVMRLAIGLSQQRSCELNQAVLDDAMGVWEEFSRDLHNEDVEETRD